MKLLLAEDDPMIGESMQQGLRQAGFVVDWARDGAAAELAANTGDYAVLVLDIGLPRQDGLTVLKRLRQAEHTLPVLVVTARDAVADRVAGLNLGADDYLVKPFDLDELVARVRALLRRHSGRGRSEMRLGTLCLDPDRREVTLLDQALALSQREFALLEALMARPGTVVSRESLEECLYGWDEEVSSNAIEVHFTLEQVAHAIMRHGVETTGEGDEAQDDGRFISQMWEKSRLVYASRPDVALPRQPNGFAVVTWNGEEWRTYTLHSSGFTIQVAAPKANRVLAYARLANWLLLPLAILVAGLGLLIWMAVVRALAPLEQVRREIGVRDVAMLHPIDMATAPEEIRPLGEALNALLSRLDKAMSLQRRFVADAAHELRTPLTALKLQAQMATRAESEAERQQTMARLQEGIDRAARLVSQLLAMARLEPEA